MELDCIPAGMEIFPAIDEEQFEFIKRVVDDCDYYLLIVGGRYGTVSDDGLSYTEKEYEYAISKGLKVMAFLHKDPEVLPISKSEGTPELREKLKAFRAKASTNRLVKFWERADELPGLVALSLSKTIKTYPAVGWVRGDTASDPQVYKELSDLRKENQELKDTIDKLANQQVGFAPQLSDLEDVVEISGGYSTNEDGQYHVYPERWRVTLTWAQIFSLISPLFVSKPKDINIRSAIATRLSQSSGVTKPVKEATAFIDITDYQVMKTQFKVLGLISYHYDGPVHVNNLTISLTDLGEIKMLELRKVK
jgi:hypothetical protein